MPRVNFVKRARKDNPVVKKGESYYWWKFRFGPKQYSKTYPKRSQLTQSSFLSQLYDLEDELEKSIGEATTTEELQEIVEGMKGDIEQLTYEVQESLENMPEHLQDSSDSGMMLQERIDSLESWHSELENIDFEPDDPHDPDFEMEDHVESIKEQILESNPGMS